MAQPSQKAGNRDPGTGFSLIQLRFAAGLDTSEAAETSQEK